jgi:hypothetical protein
MVEAAAVEDHPVVHERRSVGPKRESLDPAMWCSDRDSAGCRSMIASGDDARCGVRHVRLVDPIAKALEVHALDDDHRWLDVHIYEGDARVRAEPFAAIEIDLSALWVR